MVDESKWNILKQYLTSIDYTVHAVNKTHRNSTCKNEENTKSNGTILTNMCDFNTRKKSRDKTHVYIWWAIMFPKIC